MLVSFAYVIASLRRLTLSLIVRVGIHAVWLIMNDGV